MTDRQAMEKRISRRAYTGPVPPADIEPLADMAAALAAEYGLHIELRNDGAGLLNGFRASYGMFAGVQSMFLLAAREADAQGNEKAGHGGERLVLEATKRGLGTCWVGGTFDRKAMAGLLPAGYSFKALITVGTVPGDKTRRERFIYRLAHRGSKKPEEMYTADTTTPDWFLQGMQAVALAPSAVNAQPVHFRLEHGRVWAEVPAARPMQLTDLGIAKLHFELGAGVGCFEQGNPGVFVKET